MINRRPKRTTQALTGGPVVETPADEVEVPPLDIRVRFYLLFK